MAPALITNDIHLVRHCCIFGLGIDLVPDVMLPDPGLAVDALVPVMPSVVGRERPVRMTVPAALSEIPKIKMVLSHTRRFLDEMDRSS